MNQETTSRDEILRRFETWLDAALENESPPTGIDADLLSAIAENDEDDNSAQGGDSFALWSAMTALTQEIKLQGRAFKELTETLSSQPGRIAEEMRAAYREREAEVRRETERKCRKEALNTLIDLRDRLGRGLDSVRKGEAEIARNLRAGWLQRTFSKRFDEQTFATIGALTKGYELALEGLDHVLDESGAKEIRCQGQLFDPRRMNAIDREESSVVSEGTVLEVYRSGYEWNGEVFRTAQVKVSGAPRPENARTVKE
jgi:molecular chaperone GrpE